MNTVIFILLGIVCGGLLLAAYTVWLRRRYPEPVMPTEVHIVTTADRWKIKLYRRFPPTGPGEPVFLCHGLAGNRFNFQLPPGGALVDELLKAGYDCWCIDLRACRSAVPPTGHSRLEATVDDILLQDLPAAVRYVLETSGYDKLHWVGHSMGGMMLYAYELTFGNQQLASAVTLGSPPGFAGVHHKRHALLVWLGAHFHPLASWLLVALAPWVAHRRPRVALLPINWDNMDPRLGPEIMIHLLDLPVPKVGAQMDEWAATGTWIMRDGTLDVTANLNKLRTPLFALFARSDPFVPLKRAEAFFNALPNDDKQTVLLAKANSYSADYNHIDMAFARNGREEVYEPIIEWFREHPIKEAKPRSGDGRRRATRTKRKPVATSSRSGAATQ